MELCNFNVANLGVDYKKYYELTGDHANEVLAAVNRLENSSFKKWEKNETVKKSYALEPEELVQYLMLPDDPNNLLRKAYAVVAKSNAGRSKETHYLLEGTLTLMVDPKTRKDCYLVDFERAKRREALLDARYTGSFITGELEVGIIKRYLSPRLVEQPQKSL
jgi:hypothetical protein